MKAVDFILNGRCTRSNDLVMSSVSASSPASNYWSSTENSQNNAWNVNFTSGNVNNNNKYNTNYVRAVSALDDEIKESWIEAYEDCCSNKYTSGQCTMYRLLSTRDLFRLAVEVENRTYHPSTSYCFVVTRPRLREIFAANFRDRIVQHWICLRLNPLFEERFVGQGNVSFNCRKGFGTNAAIDSIRDGIVRISRNYTTEAWIGKFDIRSFFMSIDKRILWEKLRQFIIDKYKGADIETLLYLTEITIFHCPQDNCIRRGRLELWDYLPLHKSLFGADPMIGMPIGNITSQLFANFYLSFFDEAILVECAKRGADYKRFVDDFEITAERKEDVLELRQFAEDYLRDELHLTLHKDKVYLQPVKHGIKMVGQVIKPGRTYTSNQTIGHMFDAVNKADDICRKIIEHGPTVARLRSLEHSFSSINSFCGFTCRTASYNVKQTAFDAAKHKYLWKVCYFTSHMNTMKIRKKYKLSTFIQVNYDRKKSVAA